MKVFLIILKLLLHFNDRILLTHGSDLFLPNLFITTFLFSSNLSLVYTAWHTCETCIHLEAAV